MPSKKLPKKPHYNEDHSSKLVLFYAALIVFVVALLMINDPYKYTSIQGPHLSLEGQDIVTDGDIFTLFVEAHDLSNVLGVQFSIAYDPKKLQYVEANEGTFFNQDGAQSVFIDTIDNSEPGLVKNIVIVRLKDEGIDGSGIIASLTFKAMEEGTTLLEFKELFSGNSEAEIQTLQSVGKGIKIR